MKIFKLFFRIIVFAFQFYFKQFSFNLLSVIPLSLTKEQVFIFNMDKFLGTYNLVRLKS